MRVIEELARRTDTPLSIDTSRPEVMREAVAAGATINDVRALRYPGAVEMAAGSGVRRLPLAHAPAASLDAAQPELRRRACRSKGVPVRTDRSVRGCGHRARACRDRPWFRLRQEPGAQLDLAPVAERVHRARCTCHGWTVAQGSARGNHRATGAGARGSFITAAVLGAQRGAKILRVHDVAAMVDALKVLSVVED